jgi:superfamily II DNA or RNA helicase/DNA-binding XRE family transcriptional regulator
MGTPVADAPAPASRVRELREVLGLTQAQLAERLGVSFVTINRWERGHVRPSDLALDRLADLEIQHGLRRPGPLPAPGAPDRSCPDFLGDPDHVRLVIEAERLSFGHLANPTFAIETSLIDALPHQRIAVYEHMLPQPRLRFLLADDAGAGKTIMAGLYIRELLARRLVRRVLIVPPAGLIGNWERELRRLFSLRFRIIRGGDARQENPFAGAASDHLICSLDTLAGQAMFARLQEREVEPYDLVIFDEAHKLSASRDADFTVRKTDRYRLAEAIAGATTDDPRWALSWSARHLLLLTATPHMGKDFPYYALWRLLEPELLPTPDAFAQFPADERAKRFIRRTKEEMVHLDGRPLYTQRQSDTLGFDLTSGDVSEQTLYDCTTAYMRGFYNRAQVLNKSAARLALGVFQRRLASSTYAVLRSFERRHERLEELITQLREGRLTFDQVRSAQRALRDVDDPFETTTPDDEAAEMGRESHELGEDRLLQLVVANSIGDLEAEQREVQGLIRLAREVLLTGHESKFEKLRDVIVGPDFKDQKLIVFTEHRDTLSWLLQRLEAMGFTGSVAAIHGGMDYRERESEVERFRKPAVEGGAQFLVATDAAGEGINLQFCRLMLNYDVPWNPARLEQRMGRIHRYGQTHDVAIVNLVANQTREGQVIGTLLHKLEAIRRQMRSDKVFDVVGRLFENVSIAEYMAQAFTAGDSRTSTASIEGILTTEQVAALREREHRLYGEGGDVKPQLTRLRAVTEREALRRLLPGYVRQFISHAAPALDLEIEGDLGGVFAFRPLRRGAADPLAEVVETYPADSRDRLSVERPDPGMPTVFLHPGEPVFERLRQLVQGRYADEAGRGAAFVDPTATQPYLLFVAEWDLVEAANPAASLFSRASNTGSEVCAVRAFDDGTVEACPVEQLLLLRGAERFPLSGSRLASKAPELQTLTEEFVRTRIIDPVVSSRRAELLQSLPQRESLLVTGYDYQAADLVRQRGRLTERVQQGHHGAQATLERVKAQQRALENRKSRAVADLRSEPDRLSPGPVRFVARALVVPSDAEEDKQRYDAEVEAAAMGVARAWEEAAGATVKDVSTPPRARASGLGDYPGFDLLAIYPNGEQRAIEVKGRAGQGDIEVSDNEWARACNLRSGYWLYTVFDCASSKPRLVRVQDPFLQLLVRSRGVTIDDAAILAVGELADMSVLGGTPLPDHLRPLFWDHVFDELRWPAHRQLVIERLLQSGGDEAVRWIRQIVGDAALAEWIRSRQGRGIDPRQLRFWQVILGMTPAEVDPWVEAARESPWGGRSRN